MPRQVTQTTFKFDQQTEEIIQRLKQHFNASTKTDVLRKALALLELARKVREEGGELARVNPDKSVDPLVFL